MAPPPPRPTLFPYTTLFRSQGAWAFTDLKASPDEPKPEVERVTLVCEQQEMKEVTAGQRSEEHTSELQSHSDLVCRLLLEKKKAGGDEAEQRERGGPRLAFG